LLSTEESRGKRSLIGIDLYYELLISKALRYDTCEQKITQLYLQPMHTFIHKWNKAIVDHTSPALCNPITPGSDEMARSAAAWRYLQQTRYNALSMGRKTPKIAPSPWDFVTLPEEDRATLISNMRKNFG